MTKNNEFQAIYLIKYMTKLRKSLDYNYGGVSLSPILPMNEIIILFFEIASSIGTSVKNPLFHYF